MIYSKGYEKGRTGFEVVEVIEDTPVVRTSGNYNGSGSHVVRTTTSGTGYATGLGTSYEVVEYADEVHRYATSSQRVETTIKKGGLQGDRRTIGDVVQSVHYEAV